MESQTVDTVVTAETLGDDANSLPNSTSLKINSSNEIHTRSTIEIVSNSDRSNCPNGGGGGSSSTSDGSVADHEIATRESGFYDTPVSLTVPEIVMANNEEMMDKTNTTTSTEVTQKRPATTTATTTTTTTTTKRSPNRYSRMKNEISNTYYPSKYKKPSNLNHSLRTSNNRTTTALSSSSSKLVPANGQPCIIHTPTLDELQSMTFTEYVRTKVISAATVSNTDCNSDEERDDDDDDDDNNNDNNHDNDILNTTGSHSDHVNTEMDTKSVSNTETSASLSSPSDTKSTYHSSPTRRRCVNGSTTTTITQKTARRVGDNTTSLLLSSSSSEPIVLREGIAKIRLPKGFFTTAPYGEDITGRGPIWAHGTILGDKMFQNPILQNIRGMTGVYEYTHTELPATTLAEFRDRADKYRLHQMGSVLLEFKKEEEVGGKKKEGTEECKNDEENIQSTGSDSNMNPDLNKDTNAKDEKGELTPEQVAQLERQFWRRLSPTMPPPVYGADEPGTLFGEDNASGWSLAKLDSCLHVLSDIPGVTSPYLYAGMWASVFCAHTEDMNLLSINYLHAGQPKIWYAVAEQDAARFVSLAEHHFVHQLQKCKEFLRHKRCLLSPLILQQAGIRYQTAIQYPGDAIVTFPGGYHFGFNAGFNIAEATNFGVLEWLPFGRKAKICLCRPDSVRIDMNRLTYLLQRYQVDVKRNKRLTWKEWRKRYERKEGITSKSKSEIIETEDEIIEVISYAPKKRQRKAKADVLLSEQERKNEFWIEVTLPSQLRKTNSSMKKGSKNSKKMDVKPWYLAKPVGRKRLEVNMKILCLVPIITPTTNVSIQDLVTTSDVDDDMTFPSDQPVEEHCFTGTIVRIEDKHALIHFDGQCKSSDIWMPLSSPKIFLNGGIWDDTKVDVTIVSKQINSTGPALTSTTTESSITTTTDGTTKEILTTANTSVSTLPVLHYWKEMDTNVLPL